MPCDYKKYPKNWKEIRERILKRAGNRCEGDEETHHDGWIDPCLAPNGTVVYRSTESPADWSPKEHEHYTRPVKIVLTIAHLDHDPENHEVADDRLRALCQRCHLRYDRICRQKRKDQPHEDSN
jgi:hypothetical protein